MFLKILGVSTLALSLVHCGELLPGEESESSESESNISGNDSEQSVSVTVHLDENVFGLVDTETFVETAAGKTTRFVGGIATVTVKQSNSVTLLTLVRGNGSIEIPLAGNISTGAQVLADRFLGVAGKLYKALDMETAKKVSVQELLRAMLTDPTTVEDVDKLVSDLAAGQYALPDETTVDLYSTTDKPYSRDSELKFLVGDISGEKIAQMYPEEKNEFLREALKYARNKQEEDASLLASIAFFKDKPGETAETATENDIRSYEATVDSMSWSCSQEAMALVCTEGDQDIFEPDLYSDQNSNAPNTSTSDSLEP